MRAAVIDIGSNSTKLVIGEKQDDDIKVIETLKNVVPIGKNTFYRGRISQEIFNEVIMVLENYKRIINEYAVKDVKVIATTAVREAENRDIFLDTVARKTGFKVEVLNVGDVVYFIDAFLSYKLKKKYPINEKNVLIAELGAGSLDISFMEKGHALFNFGIPIGTLRLKQFKGRIEGSQKEVLQALEEFVDNEMFSIIKSLPDAVLDDVVLIDESYSTYLHRILPNKRREGMFFQFKLHESKKLLSALSEGSLDELAIDYDIPPDVADTMEGYALIVNKLYKLVKKHSIFILETSLSEAILANLILGIDLGQKYHKSNQLISVAKYICRKFDSDLKHSKHVAFLAEELFNNMKDLLGLDEEKRLFLVLAAYLHNIGLFINNRSHHKHTEYIINSLSLFRLTSEQIKCIACIARYHRKAVPQKTHFVYGGLTLDEQLLVQKLSSILRLANALDSSHKQKVKKLEIGLDKKGEMDLSVYIDGNFALEKVMFEERKQLFEEISGNRINLIVKRQG